MTDVRFVDHLVLPTAALAIARERLTRLGFTVAPDGAHPFGTANCCVYFADGTFIEPLAIADKSEIRLAVEKGNVFVARDAAFRDAFDEEGFSAIVFAADDAVEDHATFKAAGISAGPILDFSRGVTDAGGKSGVASFRLAFAAPDPAAELFAFTCQRINIPNIDRAALQRHANGVLGISEIVAVSEETDTLSRFLGIVANAPRRGHSIETGEIDIGVDNPERFAQEYGAVPRGRHRLAAIVFAVADINAVRTVLAGTGIAFRDVGHRLVVDAAPGQGAIFAFETVG